MFAVIIKFFAKNFIVIHMVYIYISSSLWDSTIYYYPMKPTGTLFCKSNIIVLQIVFEICAKQFYNFIFPHFIPKEIEISENHASFILSLHFTISYEATRDSYPCNNNSTVPQIDRKTSINFIRLKVCELTSAIYTAVTALY